MKYSPHFFKTTMPEWKRKKDPFIAKIFHRPISFIFSSVFAEIGLTPNQVSFISLIIAVLTCTCFFIHSKSWYLIGAILMNLWSITDSADGNMARSIGGKPYGDFIDATSSYFMVGFIFPILAYDVYRDGGFIINQGNTLIILVGAYTGLSDTMARLFFQKEKNNTFEILLDKIARSEVTVKEIQNQKKSPKSKFMQLFIRIDSELSMGGWNLVAILICVIFNCLDLYVLFYALYFPLIFILSTFYLIKKTRCLEK